ncbi:MAG: ABC transporter permease [Chitinophagales bacterium]|nr:ABC transporter permease [Chitinophagales bacterium]
MQIVLRIFNESVALALRELRVNKLRTFLTLLGIAIGIFCLITIFSSVDSLQRNIQQGLSKFGSDVVYVEKWPWEFSNDYPWWKYVNRPYAKYDEMKQLQDHLTGADAIAISIWLQGPVIQYRDRNVKNSTVNGVSQDYNHIQDLNFLYGRYFTPGENLGGDRKVVLGYKVADQLFPDKSDPTGKEIELYGDKLTIIGVFAKDGESIINTSNDNLAMIPYQYLVSKVQVNGFDVQPSILVKAKAGVTLDELKDEIRGVMRAVRRLSPTHEDNFALNQMSILSSRITSLFGVLDWVAIIIGGFAILVGGFGIANIMFVSVRERTNLIGIKKALGAKNYFIMLEFLIEAVILSIVGGLFGLILVFITVKGLSAALHFDLVLDFTNAMRGVIIASVIGLISGFWPALSAARLNPVDAIRFK